MLKSPKEKLIFHSDAYTSEEECRRVINAVEQYAMNVEVVQVDNLEQYSLERYFHPCYFI